MASVSIRTVRYYDKLGLLSPAQHTESGYRLYTEQDFFVLQNILALKFLGFSLEEIKVLIPAGPNRLQEVLAQQKAMMTERRKQITAVIRAIEETEAILQSGQNEWDSMVQVIQAIQMNQDKDWVKNYFTEEQRQKMEELAKTSYSEEARRTLEERSGAWTEADQKRAEEQWAYVAKEADRLAEAGADSASPEAQAVAKVKHDLLSAFTQGNAEVASGLNRFWEQFRALPAEERPFDNSRFESGPAGTQLLNEALSIYRQKIEEAR